MKSISVKCVALLLGIVGVATANPVDNKDDPPPPVPTLQDYEDKYLIEANDFKTARWKYFTQNSEENWKQYIEKYTKFDEFVKNQKSETQELCKKPTGDAIPKCKLIEIMEYVDPSTDVEDIENFKKTIISIYLNTEIAKYGGGKEKINIHGIQKIFASSNNFDELQYYFDALRTNFNDKIKDTFTKMADKSKSGVPKSKEVEIPPDYWVVQFDGSKKILKDVEEAKQKLKSSYELLYSYARIKLSEQFKGKVKRYGQIPQFVTGSLSGASWENLYNILRFEDEVNLTQAMQNFKVEDMFEKAFELFGYDNDFQNMKNDVKSTSELESKDSMDCWPFTDDLMDQNVNSYRLKMCAEVTEESLQKLFSLVSEIHYYFTYKDQTPFLKRPASPGLLKGYAGALSLAGMSPENLKKMGLITDTKEINQNNFLLKQSLKTLPKFMHAFAVENWRRTYYSSKDMNIVNNANFWDEIKENLGYHIPENPDVGFDAGLVLEVLANEPLYGDAVGEIVKYIIASKISDTVKVDGTKFGYTFGKLKAFDDKIKVGSENPWNKIIPDNWKDCAEFIADTKPLLDELQNEVLKYECQSLDCNSFAVDQLTDYETDYKDKMNKVVEKDWAYNTDINEENQVASIEESLDYSKWAKTSGMKFQGFDTNLITDKTKKRLIERISFLGYSAAKDKDLKKFKNAVANMSTQYSTAKICPYDKQGCDPQKEGFELSKDLEPLMATSKHYDELAYVWKSWRDVTGPHLRQQYVVYLEEGQKIADANNANDLGDVWLFEYEDNNFRKYAEDLWIQLEPLYKNLHAYVRHKLSLKYPNRFDPKGPIPAHILGNMWAQSWASLYDDVVPYKGVMEYSLDEKLNEKFNTPEAMFVEAETFFKNVGMLPMTKSFWKKSVFTKPANKEMVCHASAWDFFKKDDFRIKMCTQINEDHFETVHHEMGHIEYFNAYQNLPGPFRTGANPGFHEAVGDTISLSVMNPKHLESVGLLEKGKYDLTESENKINYLMRKALEKIPLLPFAFIVDLWRWQLFNKTTSTDEMNKAWWKLREEYQGLMSPFKRAETDLDPAAKYHVSNDVPYIRYFIAGILQFQLHDVMCKSKLIEPVVCIMTDLDAPKAGGRLLKMLELGASKHWKQALGQFVEDDFTNDHTAEITAKSLIAYFKPLNEFIEKYLKDNKVETGWTSVVDSYFQPDEYISSEIPVIIGGLLGGIVVIIIALFIYERVKQRS